MNMVIDEKFSARPKKEIQLLDFINLFYFIFWRVLKM